MVVVWLETRIPAQAVRETCLQTDVRDNRGISTLPFSLRDNSLLPTIENPARPKASLSDQ